MSNRSESVGDDAPVTSVAQLAAFLASGEKAPADFRIGTEHEKFVYRKSDLMPVSYAEPGGIRDILEGLTRFGWQPVVEDGNVIALTQEGASVSLEPGGQLELSGAPVINIHDTCNEVGRHLEQVKAVTADFGVGLLGIGFIPNAKLDDMSMMPKGRYQIMRRYMPTKGRLGLNMMFRTSTIQVNLDFSSEADMVRKFRAGVALQPIATALFANSPFTEGRPNGFLSYRSHIWTDTDPDRTGILPFVFDGDMGYERYAEYALDVPMYFIYRDGGYIDVAGRSFRDFLKKPFDDLPNARPTIADWKDHLSTIFPEVRLKTFLEMRGADGGPWRRICALPALWVGLLYEGTALDAAYDLIADWTIEEHHQLRRDVPKHGLATRFRGTTVRHLAARVLEIADEGLKQRARSDTVGMNEQGFLGELHDIVARGKTPAERLLDKFHGEWNEEMAPLFEDQSF